MMLGTAISTHAMAANISWTGGAGSAWENPANWTGGVIPGAGDTAYINNAPSAIITSDQDTNLVIGNGAGNSGGVAIDGAGASLTVQTADILVGNAGTGVLTLRNGGTLSTAGTYDVRVAVASGSTGIINIGAATGLAAAAAGYIDASSIVFGAGTGRMVFNHTDANYVFTSSLIGNTALRFEGGTTVMAGDNSAFTGTIVLTKGNMQVSNILTTGPGTMTIGNTSTDDAAIIVSGVGSVLDVFADMAVSNAGKGLLDISNGGVVTTGASVRIASATAGEGILNVDGAGSLLSVGNAMGVGSSGDGWLNITNGGQVLIDGYLRVGSANATSTGYVLVDGAGSLLQVGAEFSVGNMGNGTLTLSNGGTVQRNGTMTIAKTGTTSVVNIGAASGDTAQAAGHLDVTSVVFGPGAGSMVFNHTDDDYVFDAPISGAGDLYFENGTTSLTGNNTFTGNVYVTNGTLNVEGSMTGVATEVQDGAMLGGGGTLGALFIRDAGILSPGNSIGTISAGNTVFDPGSIYEVEVNASGASDLLDVTGGVTINGGTVRVTLYPDYQQNYDYTIIQTTTGVTGTFDDLITPLGIIGDLSYVGNDVLLTLQQNLSLLPAYAETRNQRAVINGVLGVTGNAAINGLFGISDADEFRDALDMLSGEAHVSAMGAQLREASRLRRMALQPKSGLRRGDGMVWGYAFDGYDNGKSDGNAASSKTRNSGVMLGAEKEFDDQRHAGLAFASSTSSMVLRDRGSQADTRAHYVLGYGGAPLGYGMQLHGGIAGGYYDTDTERNIQYAGFSGASEASYNGYSGQLFAEVSRSFKTRGATLRPYAEGAYLHHHANAFSESGVAGLRGDGVTKSAGTVTLGMDTGTDILSIDQETAYTFNGGAGWQHLVGGAEMSRNLTMNQSASDVFTVYGAPLARDALVLNAGLGLRSGPAKVSVDYNGTLSAEHNHHAVMFNAGMSF